MYVLSSQQSCIRGHRGHNNRVDLAPAWWQKLLMMLLASLGSLLLFGPPVVIAVANWCKSRPRMPDDRHCRCGYDLTANTSGTCPECGTPVPRQPPDLHEAAVVL